MGGSFIPTVLIISYCLKIVAHNKDIGYFPSLVSTIFVFSPNP